ncbi:MAG: hypothetical protein ACLGHN_10800 [Bacteriovoracia bacterium]
MSDKTNMKDNRCFICKFKEDYKPKTNDDVIYDARGNSMTLPLCYGHSVELFKTGQKSFINKHRFIFSGHFGVESDLELVNYFSPARRERSWF